MYRIEIAPGEETVFRTLEEMAIGIRSGLVTPRSRIYHSASQKWLPIEFHPHYKKALQSRPVAVVPEPKVRSSEITYIELLPPEPLLPPAISYPEVTPRQAPVSERAGKRRKPVGSRALNLAMAGSVLIVSTYAVMSASAPSRALVASPPVPAPAESILPAPIRPAAAPVAASEPAAQLPKSRPVGKPLPPPDAQTDPRSATVATPASGSGIQAAPGRMDLALPSLPTTDSLAGTSLRDSAAIGRILRAVTGTKASPVQAATP
ncbi:MAG: hypothetical protein H0T90_03225 [Gemmatimonadales bacterium]|nr:hypothetical protein [Gemmatimonadales bacterium]